MWTSFTSTERHDCQLFASPSATQASPYLLHLGLQCYDRQFLSEYCRMPATPLMVWARCTVPSRSHFTQQLLFVQL